MQVVLLTVHDLRNGNHKPKICGFVQRRDQRGKARNQSANEPFLNFSCTSRGRNWKFVNAYLTSEQIICRSRASPTASRVESFDNKVRLNELIESISLLLRLLTDDTLRITNPQPLILFRSWIGEPVASYLIASLNARLLQMDPGPKVLKTRRPMVIFIIRHVYDAPSRMNDSASPGELLGNYGM